MKKVIGYEEILEKESIWCPKCGSENSWRKGPEGAGAIQLKCSDCDQEYLYAGVMGLYELS